MINTFQNYVILDRNKTIEMICDWLGAFQNYVILDRNKTR